jgi:hypothetical protein
MASGGRGTGGSGTGTGGIGGTKKNTGAACTAAVECASTFCAQGYCCDMACDGNCESCNVAGSLGSCLPVTTPKTACPGTGVCAGRCDGTAANRRTCVFPASTTTCGAAAACTNGTLTLAASCNGAGACSAAATMSCMLGCRADGGAACATNCPTNQGVCGGSCVDIQTSAAHCGSSCLACTGATSKCAGGSCVQCTVACDCTGTGQSCGAQNTCVCAATYHACGATATPCYSDTDVSHCGNGCTNCVQPNANAACGTGNNCANSCKATFYTLSCPAVGGKPNCSQWDFESTVAGEGWTLGPVTAALNASGGPLSNSTAQHATGAAALAIPFNNGGDVNKSVDVRVKLCAGGQAMNLEGKTLFWRVKMVPAPSTAVTGYNYLILYSTPDLSGGGGLLDHNSPSDANWHYGPYDSVAGTPLSGSSYQQVTGIGFHLQQTVPYNGIIYLDDINIR